MRLVFRHYDRQARQDIIKKMHSAITTIEEDRHNENDKGFY